MQDQGLSGPEWNVPPRAPGPGAAGGRVRPVLRTVYSQPQPRPGRFVETPAGPRVGARPSAFRMTGGAVGNKYGSAMSDLIRSIMRANGYPVNLP